MIFSPPELLAVSREGCRPPGPVRELKHYVFQGFGHFLGRPRDVSEMLAVYFWDVGSLVRLATTREPSSLSFDFCILCVFLLKRAV